MSRILSIWRREVRAYFTSPVAYIVLAVFAALAGFFFYGHLATFVTYSFRSLQQVAFQGGEAPKMNMNEWVVTPFLYSQSVILLFLIPLLTMRLLSEERKTGTIELLLTNPVTDAQVVLGKFLAALTMFGTMLATTLLPVALLYAKGDPDTPPLLTGYLGLVLVGATFLSIGLFLSALTENQIIAAALSLCVFLLLWVLGWAASFAGPRLGAVLTYLSILSHFDNFSKGVVDTKDLVFYLSLVTLGLTGATKAVQGSRWSG